MRPALILAVIVIGTLRSSAANDGRVVLSREIVPFEADELEAPVWDTDRRFHAPMLLMSSVDPLAGGTFHLSPYIFCAANPIANIDNDGNLTIFINGWHYGDGGTPAYWDGVDEAVMDAMNDYKAIYLDGSMGGLFQNISSILSSIFTSSKEQITNRDPATRQSAGHDAGEQYAEVIAGLLNEDEEIHIVTHSMGAAFTKGLIQGLVSVLGNVVVDNTNWEIDIAPYQTSEQCAVEGVTTGLLQHKDDRIAKAGDMKGAKQFASKDLGTTLWSPLKAHYITSFSDEIESFLRSFFKYIQENKQSENNK